MPKKSLSILFYLLVAVALSSVLLSMLRPGATGKHTGEAADPTGAPPSRLNPEAEEFVLAFYRSLDAGQYARIAPLTCEGRWRKGTEAREYHFDGIMDPASVAAEMQEDYGESGWRIKFVTLEILASLPPFPASRLDSSFRRESELLRWLEKLRGEELSVTVVTLTGHVTGACHLIDWQRRLPLVRLDGEWRVLARGAPEDYWPVRREQWFNNIKF